MKVLQALMNVPMRSNHCTTSITTSITSLECTACLECCSVATCGDITPQVLKVLKALMRNNHPDCVVAASVGLPELLVLQVLMRGSRPTVAAAVVADASAELQVLQALMRESRPTVAAASVISELMVVVMTPPLKVLQVAMRSPNRVVAATDAGVVDSPEPSTVVKRSNRQNLSILTSNVMAVINSPWLVFDTNALFAPIMICARNVKRRICIRQTTR